MKQSNSQQLLTIQRDFNMTINELYPNIQQNTLKELLQVVTSESNIARSILEKDIYVSHPRMNSWA